MKREHKMVPGHDFMPDQWCGGCETCDRMYCADVCLKCSYTRRGNPKDWWPSYCEKATPRPAAPALIHKGRKP